MASTYLDQRATKANVAASGVRFKVWRDSFHERFFGADGKVEGMWQGMPISARKRPSSAHLSRKVDTLTARTPTALIKSMDDSLASKTPFLCLVEEAARDATRPNCQTAVEDEVSKLGLFRQTIESLTGATPQMAGLMRRVMDTYDTAVKKIVRATDVAETKTLGTTLDSLQAEVLSLAYVVEQKEADNNEMRIANERLRSANEEFNEESGILQHHVEELHKQIQTVCSRVFLDTPAPPTLQEGDRKAQLRLHAEKSSPYFLQALQRLCLEIEYLRRERQDMYERLAAVTADCNAQSRGLQEANAAQAELEAVLEDVREQLSDAEVHINELDIDKEELETVVEGLRVVGVEHDILTQRLDCAEKELSHARELFQGHLERRDVRLHKDEKPPPNFVGRGLTPDIPRYLRSKSQKIKNRMVGKPLVLQIIKEIWTERARRLDRDDGMRERTTLEDIFVEVMTRQASGIEYSYSFIDACNRTSTTSIESFFLMAVLEHRLPEETYFAGERAIQQVRAEMERLGKGARRVSFDIAAKALRAVLQVGLGALARLMFAVQLDKPNADDVDTDITTYPKLCDAIKRTILTLSTSACLDLAQSLRTLAATHRSDTLSLSEIKEVMYQRDPYNTRLHHQLSQGAGIGPDDTLRDLDQEIDVVKFMDNLSHRYEQFALPNMLRMTKKLGKFRISIRYHFCCLFWVNLRSIVVYAVKNDYSCRSTKMIPPAQSIYRPPIARTGQETCQKTLIAMLFQAASHIYAMFTVFFQKVKINAVFNVLLLTLPPPPPLLRSLTPSTSTTLQHLQSFLYKKGFTQRMQERLQ